MPHYSRGSNSGLLRGAERFTRTCFIRSPDDSFSHPQPGTIGFMPGKIPGRLVLLSHLTFGRCSIAQDVSTPPLLKVGMTASEDSDETRHAFGFGEAWRFGRFGSSGVISRSPSPEEASTCFRHGWLHTRYYLRDPDHILTFSIGKSAVTHCDVIARG